MDIFINLILFILYAVLVLIVIFIVFLFLKVSISLYYKNGLKFVDFQVLFFKKRVRVDNGFLKKSQEEVKVDVQKAAEVIHNENEIINKNEQEIKKKNFASKSLEDFLKDFETIKKFLKSTKYSVDKIARKVYISDINLFILVCGQDHYETSLKFGHLNAYIHSIFAYLKKFLHLDFKSVVLRPNFVNEEQFVKFSCKISFRPVIIVKIGWSFLKIFLRKYLKKVFLRFIKRREVK